MKTARCWLPSNTASAMEDYAEFTHAIHQLRAVRMRDGAIRWGVYRDTAAPERIIENFVVESWLEFLRERERMTKSDRAILDRARSFTRARGCRWRRL